MEKEIGNSLEREDRESVFDDVVAPDPSLEGIDYATYLKIERGEMTFEEWKKQSSQYTQKEVSKLENFPLVKGKEHKGLRRTKRVSVVTTEKVWQRLKIVAAFEGKTVSTYLNDFLLRNLEPELEQANSYIRMLSDINDTG